VTDIRKEQAFLLRFEKQIAGLAATLATAGATAATAADQKLAEPAASAGFADLQNALMHLAQVTADVHASLNAKALEAGLTLLQASGGTPKEDPPRVVASILGLG
jgi:hypothetical protein